MKLTEKQSIALSYLEDDTTNELLFGGGAGSGKSLLGCYWILKNAVRFKNTRWLIGRSQLKTLKETTLATFWEVCQMQGVNLDFYSYNQQQMNIVFVNGSEILLKDLETYPSDPNFDRLGSLEITGGFIDEVSQVSEKAWNIVRSRIRYKLDEYGLIPKLLGTCNPSKGFLYSRFYKPSKEGTLPENYKFVKALLDDNPFISRHYRENLLQLDVTTKQRLLLGNWEYDSDPATLIPYNKIVDIFTATHVQEGRETFLTSDIARFGDDKSVLMVWKGLVCVEVVTLFKQPVTTVAAEIQRLKNKYNAPTSNIIVDEDGVGGGVQDILKCVGFLNGGSPIEKDGVKQNFLNLKSQCYFLLAEKVNKGEIYVRTDDIQIVNQLTEELEQLKRKDIDRDGKLAVLPKEQVKMLIGRSPDYSDAMMMRMWFELKPKAKPMTSEQLERLLSDFR